MKLHNPLPQSIDEDILKCAHIMEKFTKKELSTQTGHAADKVIPPNVIAQAKGIAIMTVVKAGFIWSGRTGSGLVVARLPSGEWSAPSAIGTAGMGVGGQIGAELTGTVRPLSADFVIILNTQAAVDAFSMGGNVTMGGNLSVAAGPFGRSAEGAAAIGKMAPIFSYSKTKGLFAGISIEGSVIVERKDANHKFYGQKYSPKEILNGTVSPPTSAAPLYRALQRQSLLTMGGENLADPKQPPAMANEHHYAPVSETKQDRYNSEHGVYPTPPVAASMKPLSYTAPPQERNGVSYTAPPPSASTMKKPPPPIPTRFAKGVALYDFEGERETDLSFKTGDLITITKKSQSTDDW
ncbi:hypothetical protein HDV03_004502 [Kappamyces sp. JEL0829]|nr:hypothetical protein HDV03_004502 [Kappamyces sp. JEL0829]